MGPLGDIHQGGQAWTRAQALIFCVFFPIRLLPPRIRVIVVELLSMYTQTQMCCVLCWSAQKQIYREASEA